MASLGRERILVVFAKAPIPGRVKTRLARELGDREAADVYRRMGRRVVRQLEGGAYRTVIYYDPPTSEPEIREWLGGVERDYLPQPTGDLGERLRHAFRWGLGEGEFVCVVGTDIPDLNSTGVEAAFASLSDPDGPDAVIGPALDGGYYLLGLKREQPELFEGIPWSTDVVLERTMSRAEKLGLNVQLLPALSDVDRWEDLPHGFRSEKK